MSDKNVTRTLIYGLFYILGIIGLLYFFIVGDAFLAVISILIAVVSLNNLFCNVKLKKSTYKNVKEQVNIPSPKRRRK